jgi:heme/copper-type cytochrome/quinol oxidase subunit 4
MANANPAARSLSSDLAIGATAVTVWMVRESRRLRMRGLLWVLLSCVTIAFAFGAPLFLHLRERRLMELARLNGAGAPTDR